MSCKGCGRLFFRCLCCKSANASKAKTGNEPIKSNQTNDKSAKLAPLASVESVEGAVEEDNQPKTKVKVTISSNVDEQPKGKPIVLSNQPDDCSREEEEDGGGEGEGGEEQKSSKARRSSNDKEQEKQKSRNWLSRLLSNERKSGHKFGNYRPTRNYKHRKPNKSTSDSSNAVKNKLVDLACEEKNINNNSKEENKERKARFSKLTFIDEDREDANK